MEEYDIRKLLKTDDQKLLMQLVLKKMEINLTSLSKSGVLEVLRKDPNSYVSKADSVYEELMESIRINEATDVIQFKIFELNKLTEEINDHVTHALNFRDFY